MRHGKISGEEGDRYIIEEGGAENLKIQWIWGKKLL